jgi:hypothetical protein
LVVYFQFMSTLAEIEEAIVQLPASQIEQLEHWFEQRRFKVSVSEVSEPDFLARAKAIWGDQPVGEFVSALVAEGRG